MAVDRVLYVGEIVAMVLAETEAAALDGAERIAVDYEPLPVVADLASALAPGAEPLWSQAPGNRCFTIRRGDPAGVAEAFDGAVARVRVDCHNNRVAGAPIEVRGYIGHVRADDGCLVLHACAGKPHPIRKTLAEDVFRVPESRIQVKVPRIGGGFGIKNVLYPEECLVLFGAQRSGRPVKWLGTRLESFQSDIGCRDQRTTGEMGFDAQGRIVAFRATFLSNLGGYLAPRGVVPVRNAGNVMSSVYRIPVMAFEGVGVHTNTTPTCSFRGSGQPEMM
jgi:carbon-monoxide dehydrogenase large subunit